MKAVNLLPSDLRRAGSGGGSASGAGAYALLAALAVAVALVGFWAVTTRQVKDREAEVTRLNAEAAAAEAQAANLSGYEATVKVAQTRRDAVVGLIEGRFDWSKAFEDVSRTVPENAWITTMAGSVAPGVAVEGGGNQMRATHEGPAIELVGCTTSQSDVARLMSRLRAMKGVTRVALQSAVKTDGSGGGGTSDSAASGGTQGDCASDVRPKFNLVILYGSGTAPDAGTAAAGGTNNAAAAPAPAAPASGGAQ